MVEAQSRGDRHVGSEHFLIGVALAPSAVVRRATGERLSADDLRTGLNALDQVALRAVGIDLDETAEDLAPAWSARRRYLPFTRGAKQVLQDALTEAIALGNRHIGPEHILLGITQQPSTDPASSLLDHLGVEPDSLRADLLAALRRSA